MAGAGAMGGLVAISRIGANISVEVSWWMQGLIHSLLIVAISLAGYFIFIDPEVGLLKDLDLYPYPWFSWFFWGILISVWLAFDFGFWPFTEVAQPLKGIIGWLIVMAISWGVVFALGWGIGRVVPEFAHTRGGDLGYVTGVLMVLFGFHFFGSLVVSWGMWPWADAGLKQPVLGLGVWLMALVMVVIGWGVLVWPTVRLPLTDPEAVLPAELRANDIPMGLNRSIGWFYSTIVFYLLTLLWDNKPFALLKNHGLVAISALVGSMLGGTGIFLALLGLAKIGFVPEGAREALGPALDVSAAWMGVCINLAILVWFLGFANWPNTGFPNIVRYFIRTVICVGAGFAIYFAYHWWIAVNWFHEPLLDASGDTDFGGNALGWIDWIVYFNLIYGAIFANWPMKLKAAP